MKPHDKPAGRSRSRRFSPQFTLGTLLFSMLVAAIFFGYSGLWWQRVQQERDNSAATIQRLKAELQAEQQAHRLTQARLLLAQSQLRDAGVRISRQLASREAAERELQLVEEYAERLKRDSELAGGGPAAEDDPDSQNEP